MGDGRTAPQRTCVGCRTRTTKSQLLRVVAIEGVLIPDPRGRQPGRGAHLHPDLACLDLAERRRAFPRALRVPGGLDSRQVRTFLETWSTAAPAEDGHEEERLRGVVGGGADGDR